MPQNPFYFLHSLPLPQESSDFVWKFLVFLPPSYYLPTTSIFPMGNQEESKMMLYIVNIEDNRRNNIIFAAEF
jgi:hypothetical protein